ncbi:MAG TPA: TlpA disulfide reductase family protein [Acidobacteriaceae bacterium]|nr:TlpA disulfide reductase family protein [Acidobacteriaceae bacterium]
MKPSSRSKSFWMILFLAAAVAIGGGRMWRTKQPGALVPIGERREQAPLAIHLLNGATWRVADHRGQIILINYWATWCGPCREELPGLVRLAQESDPHEVAIVGVAFDSGANAQNDVRSFVQRFRIPYPTALPDAAMREQVGDLALPTTILLDKHGRVARKYNGATERDDFATDIATLLREN